MCKEMLTKWLPTRYKSMKKYVEFSQSKEGIKKYGKNFSKMKGEKRKDIKFWTMVIEKTKKCIAVGGKESVSVV